MKIERYALHCDGLADIKRLDNGISLEKLLREIARQINMNVFASNSYPIGPEVKGGSGWSIWLGIITSHITIHTWTEKGDFMFDLCSCKKFDTNIVLSLLYEKLNVKSWKNIYACPLDTLNYFTEGVI